MKPSFIIGLVLSASLIYGQNTSTNSTETSSTSKSTKRKKSHKHSTSMDEPRATSPTPPTTTH